MRTLSPTTTVSRRTGRTKTKKSAFLYFVFSRGIECAACGRRPRRRRPNPGPRNSSIVTRPQATVAKPTQGEKKIPGTI